MSDAHWHQVDAGQFELAGQLNRESVPGLWLLIKEWRPGTELVEVSLKQVERIDSAGMVMLIHLIEHAKKQNCHIMLSFVPAQLSTLFQLSNINNEVAGHIKS